MTQHYNFLGTLVLPAAMDEPAQHFNALGWQVSDSGDEEWMLRKAPLCAYIEEGQPWLINGFFQGVPANIDILLADLDRLKVPYAIDLFGDAARLVRRCHST